MTGDFEIDDMLDRHGKAIAKETAPLKPLTWLHVQTLRAIVIVVLGVLIYRAVRNEPAPPASENYEKMAQYYETTARIFRALAEESKKNEEASKTKR